jgi:SAM-dependent methyltransferase
MGTGALRRFWRRDAEAVSMLDGYARWAPVYPPRPHNAVMEIEASVMAPMLALAAPRVAVDVGTGTGRNIALLKGAGATTVFGLDRSDAMLMHGIDSAPRILGDARWLPFAGATFDIVSSSLMCGDLPDAASWVREGARVLRPGGHLIYSDFHPSWSAAGWRRTFIGIDRREYQLPLHPHRVEQHLEWIGDAGLEVRTIREPKLPGGQRPVVVIFHAVKPMFRTR